MDPPIDVASLPVPAQRILDPAGPAPLRQMAAKGITPGLKPADAICVVALLAEGPDEKIAETARGTLAKLPAPLLNGALTGDILPGVIAAFAPFYARDAQVMEKILALPSISPATVASIAAAASEGVAELVATNEQRLLEFPDIIEKLYMNKSTRMSTADRVLELAVRNKIELKGIPAYKEAAMAIVNELIAEPTPEASPDDLIFQETIALADQIVLAPDAEMYAMNPETGQEEIVEEAKPLEKKMSELTITQKIRMAMLGTASQRRLLVCDSNRLVAAAVARSPAIQEPEVARITTLRNAHEEALRIIALDKEWSKSHTVKYNLVCNPRCPFPIASRFIMHLRDDELKKLAKNKNVPGNVQTAARQQLQRKSAKEDGKK